MATTIVDEKIWPYNAAGMQTVPNSYLLWMKWFFIKHVDFHPPNTTYFVYWQTHWARNELRHWRWFCDEIDHHLGASFPEPNGRLIWIICYGLPFLFLSAATTALTILYTRECCATECSTIVDASKVSSSLFMDEATFTCNSQHTFKNLHWFDRSPRANAFHLTPDVDFFVHERKYILWIKKMLFMM